MSALCSVLLADRGVVSVAGPDASTFLQGLITNDMGLLTSRRAIHAGLLSPQGKILFDFIVVRTDNAFLLDLPRASCPALVQRLSMYKLRADVEISDVSPDYTVVAVWGPPEAGDFSVSHLESNDAIWFEDPRLDAMGVRLLVTLESDWVPGEIDAKPATHDDYDAHRVTLGVPEGGKDYAFGQTFIHEALFDQLHGVSFGKGCFVGQEVVSRVEHRGSARRRIVPVVGTLPIPENAHEIRGGTSVLGELGTVCGTIALANLRLDRVHDALSLGHSIQAGATNLAIEIPAWATFSLDVPGGRGPEDTSSTSDT